jgi:fatty acid desaturase
VVVLVVVAMVVVVVVVLALVVLVVVLVVVVVVLVVLVVNWTKRVSPNKTVHDYKHHINKTNNFQMITDTSEFFKIHKHNLCRS